jgi:hypothetical protein
MFSGAFWVERGGLVGYGTDFQESDVSRRGWWTRSSWARNRRLLAVESKPAHRAHYQPEGSESVGAVASTDVGAARDRVIE